MTYHISDQVIKMWSIGGERLLRTFAGHTGIVRCVKASPNGCHIASASDDSTVLIWSLHKPSATPVKLDCRENAVYCVAWSPDSKHVASGGGDMVVRLWDAKKGRRVSEPLKKHTSCVTCVAFNGSNTCLASASSDRTVIVWKLEEPYDDGEIICVVHCTLYGHIGTVACVSFSPDDRYILTASDDNTMRMWDANRGRQLGMPVMGDERSLSRAVWSADGEMILSGGSDCVLTFWRPESKVGGSAFDMCVCVCCCVSPVAAMNACCGRLEA
jgi:WD40 repeat protein